MKEVYVITSDLARDLGKAYGIIAGETLLIAVLLKALYDKSEE